MADYLKLYFFNVGQGDSIIIECFKNETLTVAVVDCNIHGGNNPVLEFIKQREISKVDYLILSHPHTDHFSGFNELLEYLDSNKINIGIFGHTATPLKVYRDKVIKSIAGKTEFNRLLESLKRLQDSNGIVRVGYLNSMTILDAFNNKVSILSPEEREIIRVEQTQEYEEETPGNHAMGNWLSTVIKVDWAGGYILLTADCNKDSLHRIDKSFLAKDDGYLLLGQIPHHGSIYNHIRDFWKKRKRRSSVSTPVVVSFGMNDYGHPAEMVIKNFEKDEYKIYKTNPIAKSMVAAKGSGALDMYGEIDEKDISYLEFTFDDKGNQSFRQGVL